MCDLLNFYRCRFLNETVIVDAVALMVRTWQTEQHHEEASSYRYSELPRGGKGHPSAYTGACVTQRASLANVIIPGFGKSDAWKIWPGMTLACIALTRYIARKWIMLLAYSVPNWRNYAGSP